MRLVACVVALVIAVSATAGCSVVYVKGPAQDTAQGEYPQCDEDAASPYVDAATAVLFLLSGALILADSNSGEDRAAAALPIGVGAIFGISGYVGFDRMEECRRAIDDLARARGVLRPSE